MEVPPWELGSFSLSWFGEEDELQQLCSFSFWWRVLLVKRGLKMVYK